MKRYRFLTNEDIYEATNRLRDAFLAAKNGNEVDQIIKGVLTDDEKLKIGRRILIAEYLKSGLNFEQISRMLRVGKSTILSVQRNLDLNPVSFELLSKRLLKVEKEYKSKSHKETGGSKLLFKKRQYTGLKRKDIER